MGNKLENMVELITLFYEIIVGNDPRKRRMTKKKLWLTLIYSKNAPRRIMVVPGRVGPLKHSLRE